MLNLFKKKVKFHDPKPVNINYRIKKEFDNLKESDYINGFGFDSHLYMEILKARGLKLSDRKNSFEHKDRNGSYNVCGEKIVSKHHPLHDKYLVCKKTGKKHIIDVVTIGHYYGEYVQICIREIGSRSHGVRFWEVISGGDPYILEQVKENRENYFLEDIN